MLLLLTVTLGAGLVLSGCGDDDTATTPAPAPPPPPPPAPEPEPEPEPPAPEAPATPTGLHVDETTETSITWHWNAVEGALGYMVQVSLDEMFDDTDQVGLTQETSVHGDAAGSQYQRVSAGARGCGDARGAGRGAGRRLLGTGVERLDDACDGDVRHASSSAAAADGPRYADRPDGRDG